MTWDGTGAFATWFSGDIDCIHGINWLPFTSASLWMGRVLGYVQRNPARILVTRKDGRDYNTGWGDLVLMFSALANAATAACEIDSHPDLGSGLATRGRSCAERFHPAGGSGYGAHLDACELLDWLAVAGNHCDGGVVRS